MSTLLSPFVGMDPYLEEPALWGSVHTRLMNSISDLLADQVAPDFYVDIQQHVTVLDPDDQVTRRIVPDIYVAERTPVAAEKVDSPSITAPTFITSLEPIDIVERHIEVRDRRSREVITVIEVLSPWNKAAGPKRRDAFQEKRAKVMASLTHWIEIDFLRAGKRPAEVADKSDYYALLKRGNAPKMDAAWGYEVWYINLRDQLPTIAVPLRPPHDDVPLDLQAVLTDLYRRARYAESIDYAEPVPPPRLQPADEAWVGSQIAQWQAAM